MQLNLVAPIISVNSLFLKLLKFKNAEFLQSTCKATMTSDLKLP